MKLNFLACFAFSFLLVVHPAFSSVQGERTNPLNTPKSVSSVIDTLVSAEIIRGLLLGAEKYAFAGYTDVSDALFSAYQDESVAPFLGHLESGQQNAFIQAFLQELDTIRLSSRKTSIPVANEFETIGRNYKDQPSLGVQYLKISDNSQCLRLRLKDYKPKIWRDPLDDTLSTKFTDIPVLFSYKAHQYLDNFEKQQTPSSDNRHAEQTALVLQNLVKQSLVFYRQSFYSPKASDKEKLYYEMGVSLNEAASVYYCKNIDLLRSQDAVLTQKLYIHLESIAELFDTLRKPKSPTLTLAGILKKQNEIATLLNGFVQSSSLSLGHPRLKISLLP